MSVRTCLWLPARAEEAVAFYTSLLPGSALEEMLRPAPGAPPILIHFTLAGAPFTILQAEGGPAPNTSASIALTLPQETADRCYDQILAEGGSELQCGWVTDPWGISWQIIPAGFTEALLGGTEAENQRAFAAMQSMKRLDLTALKEAIAAA